MSAESLSFEIRALLIVDAFRATSAYPVDLDAIHTVGYFADAFGSVWKTRTLNESVLKTRNVPRDPQLQSGIDRLVGRGILSPTNISYSKAGPSVRLFATYSVNDLLSQPALEALDKDEEWRVERVMTREIAFAVSAFGDQRMRRSVLADASYADPLLDFDTVVELDPDEGARSRTQLASDELARIAVDEFGHSLGPAELTSIYLRHLYPYTDGAA